MMEEWVNLFTADKKPTEAQVAEYIASPRWNALVPVG